MIPPVSSKEAITRKVIMVLAAAACAASIGRTLSPRLMNVLHPGTDEVKITLQFEAGKAREISQEKGSKTIEVVLAP